MANLADMTALQAAAIAENKAATFKQNVIDRTRAAIDTLKLTNIPLLEESIEGFVIFSADVMKALGNAGQDLDAVLTIGQADATDPMESSWG